MADPVTSNKSLIQMATGTASGTWGAVLNASMIGIVDQAMGSTVSVAVSASDVNLTTSQIQNLAVKLTGTLSSSLNVTLPLNANSTTVAVGGFFVFDNQSTGAFAITVKTVAGGSTGVEVPQGVKTEVYSDGTNVGYADDAQNRSITYNGNPNGNVAGTAGSASTRASRVIDRATNQEYLCTTSGTASSAAWSVNLPFSFPVQAYLTANSDITSPVLTGDSVGATTIYCTGIAGNLIFLYNGISFVPVPIPGGQLSLALSSSSQAANGIYDALGFLNGTALVVAFSPAWQTPTAGSGARGTGAGTPQLTRVNGILVNAVQQTANNGASSYTIAANRGTYLGSVFVDSTQGQVTCHRSYGQSRKFGIWNAYNRLPITLKGGDSTATWDNTNAAWRPSNGLTANCIRSFVGLQEEVVSGRFLQSTTFFSNGIPSAIGIGFNSTASPSGFSPTNNNVVSTYGNPIAEYEQTTPPLGVSLWTSMEYGGSGPCRFYGTEQNMVLSVTYEG